MNKQFNIIIVGAGMVGATLAVALAQQNDLSIALIENQLPDPLKPHDPFDLRVSAINRASEQLLKDLAIWPLLIPSRISQFTDMTVWETQQSLVHFASAEIGQALLGHIIENRHLQQAALERCRQMPNIDLLCPIKARSLTDNSLQLEQGSTVQADLIIAADGAHSQLREWAGITSYGWSYQQTALVCTVTTAQAHQHTAYQHFLPQGPLAFLPLADPHQCSIVWSNATPQAEALSQLTDEAFSSALANAFEQHLGTISKVSSKMSFPLHLSHARNYIKPHFALVGDAAHTIHPLAGQGVNIGLLDAASLAEIVLTAHHKGRNIGSMHTLSKYQRRRKGDNIAMQLTLDSFKRLFSNDLAPLRRLRQWGLTTVNHLPLLKNSAMQHAAGQRFATDKLLETK